MDDNHNSEMRLSANYLGCQGARTTTDFEHWVFGHSGGVWLKGEQRDTLSCVNKGYKMLTLKTVP